MRSMGDLELHCTPIADLDHSCSVGLFYSIDCMDRSPEIAEFKQTGYNGCGENKKNVFIYSPYRLLYRLYIDQGQRVII